jgi:hypothetical protein
MTVTVGSIARRKASCAHGHGPAAVIPTWRTSGYFPDLEKKPSM